MGDRASTAELPSSAASRSKARAVGFAQILGEAADLMARRDLDLSSIAIQAQPAR
jgi:hypothetical protein